MPEVFVRRCCRGIQPADSAVHQYAPSDPEVICVVVHFEGNRSIDLRQPGQRAARRGLHEELVVGAEAVVLGMICSPAGDTNPTRPTMAAASSSKHSASGRVLIYDAVSGESGLPDM
jgi:hypothetical protein